MVRLVGTDEGVGSICGELENAGLVVRMGAGGPGARLKATRLGEQALAEGKVADQLTV